MKSTAPSLGVGLYSMAEAARLLRTPRRTLARWAEGYVEELRYGTKRYDPVVPPSGDSYLTFGDLVELLYVRGFREAEVPLKDLRLVAMKYRQEWETEYPFATKRFALHGQRLLVKEGEAWQHALTGQQIAFFEELVQQLIHIGDLTSEWRPLGPSRAVLLDPERSFGKPIEDESGAHTYVLARALAAENDAEAVAWWYGTKAAGVRDAAEFENCWMSARTRRSLA